MVELLLRSLVVGRWSLVVGRWPDRFLTELPNQSASTGLARAAIDRERQPIWLGQQPTTNYRPPGNDGTCNARVSPKFRLHARRDKYLWRRHLGARGSDLSVMKPRGKSLIGRSCATMKTRWRRLLEQHCWRNYERWPS